MRSELSAWQQQKFSNLFDILDNNNDGRLDEDELLAMLEQLRLDTGWPESSRVIWHVSTRWKLVLNSLFNAQTQITPERWLTFLGDFLHDDRRNRVGLSGYRSPVEEIAHLLFLLLDRDRNGQIDPKEFFLFFRALGRQEEDADECFERLDQNSDGILERPEVEDMVLEFFHSTEPGSSGDWLFGPPTQAS